MTIGSASERDPRTGDEQIGERERKRGSVQRTHRKKNRKNAALARNAATPTNQGASGQNGTDGPPRNKVVLRHAITIIAQYSPRKYRAKRIDEYSVWKPPTSSGSLSAKSNGWRLVSAKVAIVKSTNASGW